MYVACVCIMVFSLILSLFPPPPPPPRGGVLDIMVLCFYSRSIIASEYWYRRKFCMVLIVVYFICIQIIEIIGNLAWTLTSQHRTQVAGPSRARKPDHAYYTYLKVHTQALKCASTRTCLSRVPFTLVCEHQSAQVTSSLLALVWQVTCDQYCIMCL